jgi:hypothetical protein
MIPAIQRPRLQARGGVLSLVGNYQPESPWRPLRQSSVIIAASKSWDRTSAVQAHLYDFRRPIEKVRDRILDRLEVAGAA